MRIRILKITSNLFYFQIRVRRPFCLPSTSSIFTSCFFHVFKDSLHVRNVIKSGLGGQSFLTRTRTSNNSCVCLINGLIFLRYLLGFFDSSVTNKYLTSHTTTGRGLRVFDTYHRSTTLFNRYFVTLFTRRGYIFYPLLSYFRVVSD